MRTYASAAPRSAAETANTRVPTAPDPVRTVGASAVPRTSTVPPMPIVHGAPDRPHPCARRQSKSTQLAVAVELSACLRFALPPLKTSDSPAKGAGARLSGVRSSVFVGTK